jgi:L-2-hydroxyglutarate oxidase LhgO
MLDTSDAVVIGAGVIGLAIARALALAGQSVVVLEKAAAFGTGVSARSSEVIHAGLHYPAGSLKERLCIAGKHQLYDYCARRQVPHRRLGKLTFAGEAGELARLEAIAAHALRCGADDGLELLDGAQVRALEPELACAAALLSPSSGIVDSQALMRSLLGEAQDHGTVLARNAPVDRAMRQGDLWRIESGETAIGCRLLILAAGLEATDLATRIEGFDPALIPALHFAKGSYFAYAGRVPFSRLIYPLPITGGLGVHLTLDMAMQARFGPDVEWLQMRDYTVDPARHADFAAAARRIWPGLDPARLTPGYAGIRPNLGGPDGPMADFRIDGPAQHGLPGLITLFGIDSPGLTSCLAIAGHVTEITRELG